ncbi:nucleotidyltransferase family protein [Oceanospirillum sp. MED92]|uniref:Nucleotidyltransferase family protein n=2 Tax=Neptuniibacter caesariensis TaxID=207954 RepID=A0A7U8C3L6_NEPCE|nr:nucleotidyltransferase family protein [Oceanospirillum sp. MED92] [Neptuniibacter caesariensis]
MILAAGLGKRMRPLTLTKPKPLLEVAGVPLIEYHIRRLVDAGVKRIVINHAWLGDQIEVYLGRGERFGVEILYSREGEPLETAGGIRKALDLLKRDGVGSFLLVNGDVFTDYPFEKVAEDESDPYLVLVKNPSHNPAGDFAIEGGLLVTEGNARYTFSGISRLPIKLFEELELDKAAPLAPLLRDAISQGGVSGEVYNGFWADIGTPQRLEEINKLVMEKGIDGL